VESWPTFLGFLQKPFAAKRLLSPEAGGDAGDATSSLDASGAPAEPPGVASYERG